MAYVTCSPAHRPLLSPLRGAGMAEKKKRGCREGTGTRRHTALGVFLASALAWMAAGAAQGETLRQAVEIAVKTHPRVLASDALRRAAAHDVAQARGGFFPTLDVNAARGRERTESPDVRAQGADSARLNRRENGVILSQNLFAGGATVSEVDRQNARR